MVEQVRVEFIDASDDELMVREWLIDALNGDDETRGAIREAFDAYMARRVVNVPIEGNGPAIEEIIASMQNRRL